MLDKGLRKVSFILLTVALYIVLVILGTVLIFFGVFRNPFVWWQSMGSPPDKPTSIVGIVISDYRNRIADLYVETATGKIYYCCSQGSDWHLAEQPPNAPEGYFLEPKPPYWPDRFYELGYLRGRVTSYKEMIWNWEWLYDATRYVLLENGTVWQWRDDQTIIFRDYYILISIMGVVAIGLIVWRV
jgi:hypothetical protein